jgi:hypothetical protein
MATAHSKFADLFDDATRDPFLVERTYDAFLAPFNIVPGDGNMTPLAVRQQVAAASNQRLPVALLVMIGGRLIPLFLPFRRERAMGVAEHAPTDGKLFAFEGELVGTQGYLVELRDDLFNLTPRVTVPDVGHARGLLAADSAAQVLGPFADGSEHTTTFRTRNLVPVPNKYASLFLADAGGVTPRYYVETILPVIEANGMAGTCKPLTWFCLAALTTPGQGQAPTVKIDPPPPPGRHVPLLEQADALLVDHLKGLRRVGAPEVNLQPLINTILVGQQQQQQEQAVARLDRELKETTSVSTWLGMENFARLLRYTGVQDENELAPLWAALAKVPSKDRLGIFEGKVAMSSSPSAQFTSSLRPPFSCSHRSRP